MASCPQAPTDESPADRPFRAEARAFLEAHAKPRDTDDRSGDDARPHRHQRRSRGRSTSRSAATGRRRSPTTAGPGSRGRRSTAAAAARRARRGSSPRRSTASSSSRARSRSRSGWSGRRSSPTAPRSRRSYFLPPDAERRARSGASSSPSRAPARTSPASRRAPSATATSGSSTGRRCGRRGAHFSDWGILLARTDWDVPKHRGISYFLVDMRSPGIEIRPLRQITGLRALQRGVPHRRAHPGGEPARRAQRRLGRHADHARRTSAR